MQPTDESKKQGEPSSPSNILSPVTHPQADKSSKAFCHTSDGDGNDGKASDIKRQSPKTGSCDLQAPIQTKEISSRNDAISKPENQQEKKKSNRVSSAKKISLKLLLKKSLKIHSPYHVSRRSYAIEYSEPHGSFNGSRKTIRSHSWKITRLRMSWSRNSLLRIAVCPRRRHGYSRYTPRPWYNREKIKVKMSKILCSLDVEESSCIYSWYRKNKACNVIKAPDDHSTSIPLDFKETRPVDSICATPSVVQDSSSSSTLELELEKNSNQISRLNICNMFRDGHDQSSSITSTDSSYDHIRCFLLRNMAFRILLILSCLLRSFPWAARKRKLYGAKEHEKSENIKVCFVKVKKKKSDCKVRQKKYSSEGIGMLSSAGISDHHVGIAVNYIEELPEMSLLAPPKRFQTVEQRQKSIQRSSNVKLPARRLAECGFFLNDRDLLQCYSCNAVNGIEEVLQRPDAEIWHKPRCGRHRGQRFSSPPQKRLPDVEPDCPGQISDEIRDPHGQQSIYVPPGDVRIESYRLSTFEHFPVTCPISKKSLAKCGFYFTGFFDRVKCFACGRTVERWEANDSAAELKWHKNNCPFPRGGDCGNVPIASIFQRILGNTSTRPLSSNSGEQMLEQRDPITGNVTRTVRYPSDLPERIRRSGGTFEVLPNNTIHIQSGPGTTSNRQPGLQQPRQSTQNRLVPSAAMQAQHQPMRQWRMANVVSADVRRFLTNLFLNRELDRLTSFARWPTDRPNVTPSGLAKTGFFYLGDMDRTQCFSCGGVLRNWNANDNAEEEHRTHFPNCKLLLGEEPQNVPVPLMPETPEERMQNFPCRFPANPHMRSEAARLETFDQRWPMGRTAATPAEIAQAGFFFLGERDRAKCWYCNGGLQHWEYDDMPWIEHAKWFPNCQFLLSVKGQHFVYRHLSIHPHLARPIIARQDGARIDPAGVPGSSVEPPGDIPPSAMNVRQPSPPPVIIDPREELRKKRERVENVMKNSDVVKNVLAMGFSERIVRLLLQEKVDSGTEENAADIYGTVSGLLDDAMKKEEELRQEEQQQQQSNLGASAVAMPGSSMSMGSLSSVYSGMSANTNISSLGPAPGSGKYNVSYFGDDDEDRDMYGSEPMSGASSLNSVTMVKQVENSQGTTESLQEALNKIEEERMCKICFSKPADMVFVPCGHMCCCMECTQAIRQCPMCRVKIDKAIKTYLS